MSKKNFSVIQCADLKMKNLLRWINNIAPSKATVLINGESGTGKELLARHIHAKSSRASKIFYAINCAVMPKDLLESELFGYEKGAFTGAHQRKAGIFEQANGSTLLLDEISELPLRLQEKLLRVIQEGEVVRLGSSRPVNINVRIIATSHHDLRDMVSKNKLREDLYYILNVIPLSIPALRERPEDIRLLTEFFIELACEENHLPKKEMSIEAFKKIFSWGWPGNIRELKNTIERAVLLSKGPIIETAQIMFPEVIGRDQVKENKFEAGMTVAQAEKLLILKTLEHTSQNRTHAAQMLGISIRTLRNKINEYRRHEVQG